MNRRNNIPKIPPNSIFNELTNMYCLLKYFNAYLSKIGDKPQPIEAINDGITTDVIISLIYDINRKFYIFYVILIVNIIIKNYYQNIY